MVASKRQPALLRVRNTRVLDILRIERLILLIVLLPLIIVKRPV